MKPVIKIFFLSLIFEITFTFNILCQSYPACYKELNEKVFLHLDKDVYVTGENIYYKAYVVNASKNSLSLNSKILYLQLSNYKLQVVMSLKANLTDGISKSCFIIPDTLSTGYYKIKAFTNWMRNMGEDFYFSANVIIVKQSDSNTGYFIEKPESKTESAMFLPEGGKLVSNIESKIGYKLPLKFWAF